MYVVKKLSFILARTMIVLSPPNCPENILKICMIIKAHDHGQLAICMYIVLVNST